MNKTNNLSSKGLTSRTSIGKPKLDLRHTLTNQFLEASILFFNNCSTLEAEHEGVPCGPLFSEIRSYVISSVILSAAALEAYINEVFLDIMDGNIVIDDRKKNSLEKEWKKIERKPVIKKYKDLLGDIKEIETINENKFENPGKLIKIRNEFLHYKPVWGSNISGNQLETLLSSLKNEVSLSSLVNDTEPLFLRFMTSDFSKWAIKTVLNFIKWFNKSCELEDRFDNYRIEFGLIKS